MPRRASANLPSARRVSPNRGGYLLGLDLGTTTVRAILFDLAGAPVADAYREPHVIHPRPGWAEMDAEEWWQCTAAVIREAVERAAVPADRVLGLSLSGLMHALIPVDRSGSPLANAMLWMDQRCRAQAGWLQREHGRDFRRIARHPEVSTTWSAPKLRWIAEHQPELLERAATFLLTKDFVRFRLTGTLATDPTDAGGTLLFDPRRGDWSARLLELAGVPREKMPEVRPSTALAGTVTEEAAAATGLTAGTPVAIGGSDTLCTCLGADALGPGRACLYLGTAAWIAVRRPRAGHFGSTATTGAAVRWLAQVLGLGSGREAYEALAAEAGQAPAGAQGLIFLPHLMGERGPAPDPQARGVLFGLSLAHGRAEIARAVLEGCAFQLRAIVDHLGVPVKELVVVGGGARSALWRDIIADVTGVTLLVPRVLEAGALGAAILAGVGVGIYPSTEEAAARLVHIASRREPEPQGQALYARLYPLFCELEERVAPLYAGLPASIAEEG